MEWTRALKEPCSLSRTAASAFTLVKEPLFMFVFDGEPKKNLYLPCPFKLANGAGL